MISKVECVFKDRMSDVCTEVAEISIKKQFITEVMVALQLKFVYRIQQRRCC